MFLASMYMLSKLTLDAGQGEFFWPLILRGVGLGCLFVPLTNATVAGLPMRQIGQGTGLFNLMRQLGGSLGIAIMATSLSRLTKLEKATLTDHVGTYDPMTVERITMMTRGMMARGADAVVAKQQALLVLDRQISAQASVLAFSRLYLISGLLLVSALPLLLIWRTGRSYGIKTEIPH